MDDDYEEPGKRKRAQIPVAHSRPSLSKIPSARLPSQACVLTPSRHLVTPQRGLRALALRPRLNGVAPALPRAKVHHHLTEARASPQLLLKTIALATLTTLPSSVRARPWRRPRVPLRAALLAHLLPPPLIQLR